MFKKRLLHKILAIIAATLCTGLLVLGGLALWLQYRSSVELQARNSRMMSRIIVRDIAEFMMKEDAEAVAKLSSDARTQRFGFDLRVFDSAGHDLSGKGGAANAQVLQAFATGQTVESRQEENGIHSLRAVVPLVNEERCKRCHDAAEKYRGAVVLTSSLEQGYQSARHIIGLLVIGAVCFFFAMLALMYLFLKRSVVRDISDFSEKIRALAQGEGDLTCHLPVNSQDEIGQLAEHINLLICKLKEIVSVIYQLAETVSVSLCEVATRTVHTVATAEGQKERSHAVAVAAEEMAATLNVVAGNTHHAAEFSMQVDGAASEGMTVVDRTCDSIRMIRENVVTTLATVERLEASSGRIGDIVELIEDVADQTKLLALNAAIEAARAGEHGRGFAVVADEVKTLSEKTAASTKEIAAIIATIQKESREASLSIGEEQRRVEEGVEKSLAARGCLERILALASETAGLINQIASATEEQSATTTEISEEIHHISHSALAVHQEMSVNDKAFAELTVVAEQIFSTVGKFSVGNRHDGMKHLALELAGRAAATIDQALAEGTLSMDDLFDRNYRPIPQTDPQKYATRFDSFFDRSISPLQEEILSRNGELIFVICVDERGYCPCHNLRYAKPLSGDKVTDRANNRTKRIFDDKTGGKAARNTEPFLLQTYMRDTGEILNDISAPIFIANRHWGAVRIGYRAK